LNLNGASAVGNGSGKAAIMCEGVTRGNLIIDGPTIYATGSNGGNGIDETPETERGGDGGNGISGIDVTIKNGTLFATGGSGGNGLGESSGTPGKAYDTSNASVLASSLASSQLIYKGSNSEPSDWSNVNDSYNGHRYGYFHVDGAQTGTDITYLGWSNDTKALIEKTAPTTIVKLDEARLASLKDTDKHKTDLGKTGETTWYITDEASATVTDKTIISGTVNLILKDSTTLTLNGNGYLSGDGIHMDNGSTLNIYTQSDGANKGVLNVSGYNGVDVERDFFSTSDSSANLNLYGGALSFTGTTDYGITGVTISIYSGTVNVASRLVGSYSGIKGNVISYGGILTASGGSRGNNVKPGIEGTITAGDGFTVSVQTKDTEGGTWTDTTLTDNKTNAQFVKVTATKPSGSEGQPSGPSGDNTPSGPSGGGGTPASSSESYTIPIENESSVSVGAEIKDGTATVNEITDEQIAQATQPASGSEGAQEQSDTLTIDLSGAKQKVDTVEIPEKTVEKLADAASDSNNNVDKVAVKLSQGEIEFDADAMNTISNEATGSVKVEIAEKKATDLNASQQASLEGKQTEMVFGVNVSSNGKEIHQFNGNAKVSKNHVATKDKNFYHIEYLPDNGKAQRLVSEHTGNQGIYKERHASDYAIVYDENDQNENIKPIVGVSAKSLTYNGKKQNVKNLKVEVLSVDDVEVPASAYEISGKTSGKNVGTYNISIKAKGDSGFRDGASGTWKINKGKTSFKLKGAKVAAKKLEKKGKTVKVKVNKLSAGSSKPTFKIKKVTKGQKKNVEINKKTGAVTIKKGCGKCEITVVATSKANKNRKKGKATAKVVVK
jgi:hypothetical protein